MSWLAKLFGREGETPECRSALQTGFHWELPALPALAAGRGYNQAISGESFYRDALERLAGGQTVYGVTVHKAAELHAGEYRGAPAVFVHIEGARVGRSRPRTLPLCMTNC